MTYTPPIAEQAFVLSTIADIEQLARYPRFSGMTAGLERDILEEAGRLAGEVFAPLNRVGDVEGARWSATGVTHPRGFAEAYRSYIDGGWASLAAESQFGGQDLPFSVAIAVGEQFASANMAFSLCMILSAGAIDALVTHGSEQLQKLYLPKLISGEWTGTMNLTEPQAGSDVGALRTTASPAPDGTWRIKGSKIFITWGEHQLAENIVHLVLARTPGSPPGTRGISLFVVPKFLPDADGRPGKRNDVRCVSIEEKLGIHASPTCTMSFGDQEACVGWLIGEEQGGMRAMFTMMNSARVNVGLEGVAIAERAYQGAVRYARDRVQSSPIGGGAPIRIVGHPDVRRMLLTMRAIAQACRAILYFNAAAIDRSRAETDERARQAAQGLANLLTPISKSFATDMGVQVANIGIQIHGGMGYIEETGAAQHLRDIRIAPIYEGTNGIQALDLVMRKLPADGGSAWQALFADMESFCSALPRDGELGAIRAALEPAVSTLKSATEALRAMAAADAASVASPYLQMFGAALGAYLLSKQAQVAAARLKQGPDDAEFLSAKILTARFFATQILPQFLAVHSAVTHPDAGLLFGLSEEQL